MDRVFIDEVIIGFWVAVDHKRIDQYRLTPAWPDVWNLWFQSLKEYYKIYDWRGNTVWAPLHKGGGGSMICEGWVVAVIAS
jgi:hypothetical protein